MWRFRNGGGGTQLEGGHQSTLRLTPDRRTLTNIFFVYNKEEIIFGSFVKFLFILYFFLWKSNNNYFATLQLKLQCSMKSRHEISGLTTLSWQLSQPNEWIFLNDLDMELEAPYLSYFFQSALSHLRCFFGVFFSCLR